MWGRKEINWRFCIKGGDSPRRELMCPREVERRDWSLKGSEAAPLPPSTPEWHDLWGCVPRQRALNSTVLRLVAETACSQTYDKSRALRGTSLLISRTAALVNIKVFYEELW